MVCKQRKRYKPNQEELLNAPPRIQYERDMFFKSYKACLKLDYKMRNDTTATKEDDDLRIMTLEVTLLHARNLLDFFTGSPSSNDNIQAAHFLPNSEGNWWKSSNLGLLSSLRDDLNYSISHLAYRRTTICRPKWDLEKIAAEVRTAFEEFRSLLPTQDQEREEWQWLCN